MGFFDKMFGKSVEYPALDSSHPIAPRLQEHRSGLETLAKQVSDPLEVVPSGRALYVFIGKPPKKFGLAKVAGSRVQSFQEILDERKLGVDSVGDVIETLRGIYEASDGAPCFAATFAVRQVVVTPSPELGTKVDEALQAAG